MSRAASDTPPPGHEAGRAAAGRAAAAASTQELPWRFPYIGGHFRGKFDSDGWLWYALQRAEEGCDMSRAASDTPPPGHEAGRAAAAGAGTHATTGSAAPAAAALTHLQRLRAESNHILPAGGAEGERPGVVDSLRQDSAGMPHPARHAC